MSASFTNSTSEFSGKHKIHHKYNIDILFYVFTNLGSYRVASMNKKITLKLPTSQNKNGSLAWCYKAPAPAIRCVLI